MRIFIQSKFAAGLYDFEHQ